MAAQWSLDSWQKHQIQQQPQYDEPDRFQAVVDKIRQYPTLVSRGEVRRLRHRIAQASQGECFILQGGDCAERFEDCHEVAIVSKLKILLQMSVVLCYGQKRPIIRVGRIAGQYAKPRSSDFETVDGQKLPSYRGDSVNDYQADADLRRPDPERLLHSYQYAAMTLNHIRAVIGGGFADLHHPDRWNLSFLPHSANRDRYQQIVTNINDAIAFLGSFGGLNEGSLGSVEFFTSHEGLLLGYEQALTRPGSDGRYYDLSAHMLWIGDRTRQIDGAHVEFFRGVANPVGIKVGPTADPKEIVAIIDKINPDREPGRVVLITRYGKDKVSQHLPSLIQAVQSAKAPVLWTVDPMHGNTTTSSSGVKTRPFDAIIGELRQSFEVHRQQGSILGGVHFELTGEDVTECVGGAQGIGDDDLLQNYVSYCDPRLNYNQSLEMAFEISSF